MAMYSCAMHQPVEWDFGVLVHHTDALGQQLPDLQIQQQHQNMLPAQTVAHFQDFVGSWSSMHQPCLEWESSALPPQAASAPQPSQQPLQSSTQQRVSPSFVHHPAPSHREPAKRERSTRRAKSTTLRPQQQQMLELQKKLEVLVQEHAVVEAENLRLKTRLRVLEAVLPVREQQARWAQTKPAKTAPQYPDPKLASLLDIATSGPSSCATSPSRLEHLGSFRACEDESNPGDRVAVKHDVMVVGSPAHAPAGDAAPCASSSSCNPTGEYGGANGGGAAGGGVTSNSTPHPHSESEARWLEAWRVWIREAALLLQAHDARPNDHYLRRLEEAFMRLKSEVVYLGLRHPELVCNMRCINLETGAEQEVPPDSYWNLVAVSMRLTPQQVANCRCALALYRERMAVVLAERRGLTAQLSSCLGALQLDEEEGRAAPGSMRREQLTLEAEEVTAMLDANVAAEGHTTALARDLLGSSVFSRVQVARASVLSYPYFPDALAIITAAVAEAEAVDARGAGEAAAGAAAGGAQPAGQQAQPQGAP